MAQNSRPGAVRKKKKGPVVGSGGQRRKGLEGRGPTPKAEDRVYHKAYKAKQAAARRSSGRPARPASKGRPGAGPEWVAGRNPVLEALHARGVAAESVVWHDAGVDLGADRLVLRKLARTQRSAPHLTTPLRPSSNSSPSRCRATPRGRLS